MLDFNGELYRVRASGEAAYGFDGKPVFKIELAYPELPNSRFIELSAVPGEGFLMKLYESPDNRIAESFIETLHVTNPRLAFAKQLLERRLGADYLKNKLGAIFSPSLLLVDERAELREDILAREESSAEAENKTEDKKEDVEKGIFSNPLFKWLIIGIALVVIWLIGVAVGISIKRN